MKLLTPICNLESAIRNLQSLVAAIAKCKLQIENCKLVADQRGSISIASIFALLILVMLLGLVVNVGRQVDRKVKLQNAADAATQSSGVVLARQMNSLAFTNHLLCDVFALTAGLREVQGDPPPPVSEARQIWLRQFASSTLPVLEPILAEELITQYQRTALVTAPELAQVAADGITQGHSAAWPRPALARGSIWPAQPAISTNRWLLPVIDPAPGGMTYSDPDLLARAVRERRGRARDDLNRWNREWLGRRYNSRPGRRWRQRTERQLDGMLAAHSETNLPMLIAPNTFGETNPYLDANFHFIGVVYAAPPGERMPGLFRQPFAGAQQSYAQMELFIPTNRLQWQFHPRIGWVVGYQGSGRNNRRWDLWNQNWTVQLVPATSTALPAILSATPDLAGDVPAVSPHWRNLPPQYVRWLSHH